MLKLRIPTLLFAALFVALHASAQRQMENLGRGVVAARTGATQVYVGWRLLGTDPEDIAFNVYRVTGGATNLLAGSPVTGGCNLVDSGAAQASAHSYFVRPVANGIPQTASTAFVLPANSPLRQYLSIPLQIPAGGTAADGVPYSYNANDCSAADLDGDGEYEIVLKWDPTNSKDNSQSGFTGNVLLDAYKLNGARLWRIDLGPNIRAGAHYTQFMVYDLDGDGRAEVGCKTAPGTRDGPGNNVILAGDNPDTVYTNSAGYILSGPEYFTIFDGLTGANLATASYVPARGNVSSWGDSYGNRVDRFLACVAYLDGVRPSIVMCRGYYTRAVLAAWDWRNGQLTQRWVFDTGFSGGPWSNYKGQGAHSLTVGDVDGDGKDEITYGACAIDDNGAGLYTTGLGHGDALHMSDMHPDRPGLEVWMVHESPGSYGQAGLEFRDAKTGALIFGIDGQNSDVGRGVAIDIDPNYRGYELWGSRGGLMNATGVQLPFNRPGQQNFAIYWDADLSREILDGTTISKYNPANGAVSSITLSGGGGLSSNNGTKATPALSADLFGDWREEVIWRTSANNELRIFTTTTLATNRIASLMHDPQYRLAVAWQNVAYNQPPHPGFFIGAGMAPPPRVPMSQANLVWRGGLGANAWDAGSTANWFTNNLWVSNTMSTVFSAGKSVLFDLSGSNNTPVILSGLLSPSEVTVHSAKDFVFAGAGELTGGMKLIKAGPGRLTLINTNAHTGATLVSGGALFVNGALTESPVIVERRGAPEGSSQIGGAGRLGQGLIVQAGCGVVVGTGTNAAGTLTVSNQMTELGAVQNRFDLSIDPTGLTNANDLIDIVGNLTLSGTNRIEINQLNGFLGGGVYTLFRYSGNLNGSLASLALSGSFLQPVALTNPPGSIGLIAVVPAAPPLPPSGLFATPAGAFQINLAWADNSSDENAFLIERSPDNSIFTQIASVSAGVTQYSDVGLSPGTIWHYRVRGTNFAGFSSYSATASAATTALPPSLTWRGDGASNVWDVATTPNWFAGSGLGVYDDGVDVTFDQSGSNSPSISLSGVLRPDSVTVNASKSYTFTGSGSLAGPMALVKSGSGGLTLNVANTFTGGVTLNSGTLTLGNSTASGTGPLRLNGGVLALNSSGGPATYANAIQISNAVAFTIAGSGNNNQALSGSWTGSNTVNATIGGGGTFSLQGNMTAFSGTLALGASAGTLRFYNNATLGSGVAAFDLGSGNASLVNRDGSTTVRLGALTGGSGTFVRGRSSGSGGSGSNYETGGKNLNTTFSGQIINGGDTTSITKVGTGVLTLTGSNSYTGTTTVLAGALLINGNNSNATGSTTVAAAGKLGGTGTLGGNTIVNGTLAPGVGIGTLTCNGNLALTATGNALVEVSKSPFTNDVVRALGSAAYGGALNVVNTSVELLEAGDNFKLFDAASYSGSFSGFNLPVLEEGLEWKSSRLAVDGRLWVVNTNSPVVSSSVATGGGFTLSGSGGTPGWDYYVLTSTNVALPLSQWSPLATNTFDASGNFVFSTNGLGSAQRFFVLQVP